MSVLFGILMSYRRLAEDNEITAIKALGANYKTICLPTFLLVFLISVFLLFFNHFAAPAMHSNFRNLYEEILTRRPLVKFEEKSVTNLAGYNLYVNKIDNNTNTLKGVGIYKFNSQSQTNKKNDDTKKSLLQNSEEGWRIAASSANVSVNKKGVNLILHKGYWQKSQPDNLDNIVHMTFEKYVFFIPMDEIVKTYDRTVNEMTSVELSQTIKEYKKNKTPYSVYENEFYLRFVFAVAPIAFALCALPIGIMASGKGGKAASFGISLAIILLYYVLFIICLNLAEKEFIKPGIILWLPDIVVSAAGILLVLKMIKK
jgi:lipopolysaccharide export LptBFGC system permease protein LptF